MIIITTLAIVVLLAFAGLAVDLGRIYVAQRQLQQAVDAASLAASQDLASPALNASDTAFTSAQQYGASGVINNHAGMTAVAPTVTFLCLGHTTAPPDSSGAPCLTSSSHCQVAIPPANIAGCNAVRVKESATVSTPFLGLLGLNFASFNTVSASSTASIQGGLPHPLDVAIVIDTSLSMADPCTATIQGIIGTPTKLDCVKDGIRSLLQVLLPCSPDQPSCGAPRADGNVTHADDEVSLFVFPGLKNGATDTTKEYDCGSQKPPVAYVAGGIGALGNYEVVPFVSDYRANDNQSQLSVGSKLVRSVWWTNFNPGAGFVACALPGPYGSPPSSEPVGKVYGVEDIGGIGSQFADAIQTAQAALAQNAGANPGRHAQPVIIFLSDGVGDGTGPPAVNNPCGLAATQATTAKNTILAGNQQGTWIYSIVYNSSGNCSDKSGTYQGKTGVKLMQDMATNITSYFFNQPSAGSLTTAFQTAGATLTGTRLVPDSG